MEFQEIFKGVYSLGRLTPNGVDLLGTCFLLDKPGLFATALHVTNNDDRNLVIFLKQNQNINEYQDTTDPTGQITPISIEKVDPVRDICILKMNGPVFSPIEIGGTDNISVLDNIVAVGYPHCTNGRHVLTAQLTTVGSKILIEASSIKSKHIVLNTQTRPGQSGSPIFKASTKMLVGMIIGAYIPNNAGGSISLGGIDPQTLHQTTHAISTEYILNMI